MCVSGGRIYSTVSQRCRPSRLLSIHDFISRDSPPTDIARITSNGSKTSHSFQFVCICAVSWFCATAVGECSCGGGRRRRTVSQRCRAGNHVHIARSIYFSSSPPIAVSPPQSRSLRRSRCLTVQFLRLFTKRTRPVVDVMAYSHRLTIHVNTTTH